MKTIKFRAWDNEKGMYFSPTYEAYRGNLEDLSISTNGRLQLRTLEQAAIDESVFPNRFIVEEFTGLHDKNGKDIYEGDIVRFKRPYRSTQTHTGDNIPNGSYTEPMEPAIETHILPVEFTHGVFGIKKENFMFDKMLMPLIWECDTTFDEDAVKDAIPYGGKDVFDWHNGEDGDLDYLLEEYSYASLAELLADISGIEIIGNIHEHPELL